MKFLEPPQQEENITALKAELCFKILPNSPGIGWASIYHCWREGELCKLLKHLGVNLQHTSMLLSLLFVVVMLIIALCLLRNNFLWEDRTTHLLAGQSFFWITGYRFLPAFPSC